MLSSLRGVALLAAVVLACPPAEAAPVPPPSSQGVTQVHKYVALGDSYAAAPGVDPVDGGSGICMRSLRNYPSQVAEALGLTAGDSFVDVSCSGATSYDFGSQLDAVTPDTDLVTVTVGADNDGLVKAIFFDCNLRAGASGPDGHACEDSVNSSSVGDLDESLARTEQSIADALTQVHETAPKATVLVVPYLQLGAEWCPAWSPFSKNDARFIAGIQDRINKVLKDAAASSGARFVDVYSASASHGVCSDTPWVAGGGPLIGSGVALHPLPAGEDGMAKAVETALGR